MNTNKINTAAKKLLKNPLNVQSTKNLNSSKLILVRHAESEFNKSISLLEKKAENMNLTKQEFRKMQKLISANREFIDSPITDWGISQCRKAAAQIVNEPIKYVFVSPMRRCLETCRIILEHKLNLNLKNDNVNVNGNNFKDKGEENENGLKEFKDKNANANANFGISVNGKSAASQFNFGTANENNDQEKSKNKKNNNNDENDDNKDHLHLKQIIKENRTDLKVIVHPYLFEKIEDSCDLLGDIYKNRDEYNYFDWSLFNNCGFDRHSILFYQSKFCDNNHIKLSNDFDNNNNTLLEEKAEEAKSQIESFYFDSIKNEILKSKLIDREKIKEIYHDTVINGIHELFEKEVFIESSFQTFERLNFFKEFVSNFIDIKKIERQAEKEEEEIIKEKILVVGHSVLFKHFTSNYLSEEDFSPGPDEYKMSNCEFLGVNINL